MSTMQEALREADLAEPEHADPSTVGHITQVKTIQIIGAYGREYWDYETAYADWLEGKDFIVYRTIPLCKTGRYINTNDRDRYAPRADIVYLTKTGQMIHLSKGEK